MRVLLKLVLDCEPETAWAKLHDPATFAQVMRPLMTVKMSDASALPERWQSDEQVLDLRAFGFIPVGSQSVRLAWREGEATGINVMRDTGRAQSGMLTLLHDWDHRMALSPLDDGRTLFRDQLRVKAGWLTPLVWPTMWVFWQWRGARLRRLARDW